MFGIGAKRNHQSPDKHVPHMVPSRDLVDAKDLNIAGLIIVKLPGAEVVEGSLPRKLIMAH